MGDKKLTVDDAEYLTKYLALCEKFFEKKVALGPARRKLEKLNEKWKDKVAIRKELPLERFAKNYDEDFEVDFPEDDPGFDAAYEAASDEGAWFPSDVCY